ncbi:MAG: TerB N-terminal domain-containing protein [Eubacterium sp.]|nr:TerB N-terminal domain-containing protein [Eubacterium sp.]
MRDMNATELKSYIEDRFKSKRGGTEGGVQLAFTLILGSELEEEQSKYRETPIPEPPETTRIPERHGSARLPSAAYRDPRGLYNSPARPTRGREIPEKIRALTELFDRRAVSFGGKCRKFVRQGRFMETYEDDAPWDLGIHGYFTTYEDLNPAQLRGYFSWRTKVRKGIYEPIGSSMAYIYLYELLNGIGVSSVEESIRKLKEFDSGYPENGMIGNGMHSNIRRWAFELAVISGQNADVIRKNADPEVLKRDSMIAVLRRPGDFSDEEVFDALCYFNGEKLRNSAAVRKHETDGKHLFAEVWRKAAPPKDRGGINMFASCMGPRREFNWHPLGNAVFWNRFTGIDQEVVLNECHSYSCRGGKWKERCYHSLYFNKTAFGRLIRETDRRLRLYLNTGHPLKERPEDKWFANIIECVIAEDRKAKEEAAKPKITICFDDLDRIRSDAVFTRESLLTEDEKDAEIPPVPEPAAIDRCDTVSKIPLDNRQIEIIGMIIDGLPVKEKIRSWNMLPEVFADSLNELFFDEIGDAAFECDGDEITLVEDYRDDIMRLLGEN